MLLLLRSRTVVTQRSLRPFSSFRSTPSVAPRHSRLQNFPSSQLRQKRWASVGTQNSSKKAPPGQEDPKSRSQGNREREEKQEESQSDQKKGFFQSDRWIRWVGYAGAAANWGIPLAAIMHVIGQKDPQNTIDPRMTSALVLYSMLFMRWALAISPPNYPLCLCHVINFVIQSVQLGRWTKAHYFQEIPPASSEPQAQE